MAADRARAMRTIGFAAVVCLVCSIVVSTSAVLLRPRQEHNAVLDRQRRVLMVAGLVEDASRLDEDAVARLFHARIRPLVVELRTGEPAPQVDPEGFDPRRATLDPLTSRVAPDNPAGVTRLPRHALLFHVLDANGETEAVILPVEGKGLWSTMYGYLALAHDTNTIRGITFYQHGETPGLGGEVDDPDWQRLWRERKAFGPRGEPAIRVIKGHAGSPAEDPHQVDGLSGATLTGRGVGALVRFWLGPDGFGPYLERVRREGSTS